MDLRETDLREERDQALEANSIMREQVRDLADQLRAEQHKNASAERKIEALASKQADPASQTRKWLGS